MENRICPECGKPLPEGSHYQRVYHAECAKKRSHKSGVTREAKAMQIDREYNDRVHNEDKFWDRISVASQSLGTSYGKMEHEAFKRGISIEELLDRLGA